MLDCVMMKEIIYVLRENSMKNVTLVIMAAGIGSRFGGGIKQLAPVGPNGEIIMDYSIYDAKEAGFNKVVFVIRKSIEKEFDEVIGSRIKKFIDVEYVYQELDLIPEEYRKTFKERQKPWGTGQAILCCKNVIHEPFLIINADDYYGKQAYQEAYQYLTQPQQQNRLSIAMVSFVLKNTLSDNGGVTRGICQVSQTGYLTNIVETQHIEKGDQCAFVRYDNEKKEINLESAVSMNMWACHPDMFDVLDRGFELFLAQLDKNDLKSEYLLPTIIGQLLEENKIDVKVLKSHDQWFGVTYQEDKDVVVDSIKQLVENGVYPKYLY